MHAFRGSRAVYIFIPARAAALQLLSGVDATSEWVRGWLGMTELEWGLTSAISIGVLLAVAAFLVTQRRFKRLHQIDAVATDIIEMFGNRILDSYKNKRGIELRLNVMLPRNGRPTRVGKNRSWRFFPTYLTMFWRSENMRYAPDATLSFPTEEGVADQCYREKTPIVANFNKVSPSEFNAGDSIASVTSDLRFVLSFPILETDPSTGKIGTSIVGVVNLDSLDPSAVQLIQNDQERSTLVSRVKDFAELCSKVL